MFSRNLTPGRIMARLAALVGICLVITGAQVSCNSNGQASIGNGGGATFESSLTLRDVNQVETASFVFGEPIRLDFKIDNLTSHQVRVQFADTRTHDFIVVNGGSSQLRWQWSQGQAFAQVTTELLFEANSTKTFTLIWNGVLADGSHLPVGNYQARGVLLFGGFDANPLAANERASPLVRFSVR